MIGLIIFLVIIFSIVGGLVYYYYSLPQYKTSDEITDFSSIPTDKLSVVGMYKVPTSGTIPAVVWNPDQGTRYYPGYFDVDDSSFTYISGTGGSVQSWTWSEPADNRKVFLILSKNGKYNVDKDDKDSATALTTSAEESKTFNVCSTSDDVTAGRYASTRGTGGLMCYSGEPTGEFPKGHTIDGQSVTGVKDFKYL